MSHIQMKTEKANVNFLASAVGVVTKTTTVSATGVTADDYGYKIVPAGTIYPANDATAAGILFTDVDVTSGDHEGPLMVAGRVVTDRLPVAPAEAAKTALEAVGIKFVAGDDTTVA